MASERQEWREQLRGRWRGQTEKGTFERHAHVLLARSYYHKLGHFFLARSTVHDRFCVLLMESYFVSQPFTHMQ